MVSRQSNFGAAARWWIAGCVVAGMAAYAEEPWLEATYGPCAT